MSNSPLRLSVLDIGPIRSNQTSADCMASMIDLAQHAESLGFSRYWLGEHHNVSAVAASQTAVLSGVIGANTRTIRIGGCVLLSHYSPYLVAEQAAMVEACFPGRFDLGIGRSTGADGIASAALRAGGTAGRSSGFLADHRQSLEAVQALLSPEGARVNATAESYRLKATANPATVPPLWIFGTSVFSARMAAEMGLPYAFGYHITGDGVDEALASYRQHFRPSAHCTEPTALISAIVVIGDTVAEAERLARAQLHFMCGFRSGERGQRQMLVEEAANVLFPARYDDLLEMFRRTWIIDTPQGGAARISALAQRLGLQEMMINPVAAAYRHQAPDVAPNRRKTLSALAAELALLQTRPEQARIRSIR